jgi:TnpA family transposase
MMEQYGRVRRFLPPILNTVKFSAAPVDASDLVFSLFWLLKYQFSPLLADAGVSVFCRMENDVDYGVLSEIARGLTDSRKIGLHSDEIIRAAGTLKLSKVQAQLLLRSLLKSERPSGLLQAITETGRISKKLYLLNNIYYWY